MSLLILSILSVGYAIQLKFVLQGGQTQCFSDELPQNILLYGKMESNSTDFRFDLSQSKNDKEEVLDSEENQQEMEFHHVTEFDGQVLMCFEAKEFADPIKIAFQYDAGGESHDFEQIAQKGQAQHFNQSIYDMEVMQRDISKEQVKLIQMEGQRNAEYVDVSSKIIGFGGVTFSMLLIVAACQIIYIKRYFVYKKLI